MNFRRLPWTLCLLLLCPLSAQEAEPTTGLTPEEQEADVQRMNAEAEVALPSATKRTEREDVHVVSQSRLFSVSGGDSLRMGAIATHADDVYKKLCKFLRLNEKWENNISIRLLGQHTDAPRLNPIRTRISILDGKPHFQIRIYPGGGIDLARLDNAIVAVLLYEYSLRGVDPGAFPEDMSLPDWLVTGIQQAMAWRSGKVDRRLYRSLFERAEMLSPEEMISLREPWKLDAASRQVYEVSCGVLILSLIDREGGTMQLTNLLAEAALADDPPVEMITAHFHELGVDSSLLSKWWAIELANLALPRASEAMTPLESEKQLVEALRLVYYDAELQATRSLSLDNMYALVEIPEWRSLLQPSLEQLVKLSHLCFPGYRPIIVEYCRLLSELMSGAHPDTLQDRLGPLRELREAYYAASIRGRDYLDWFEITYLGQENRRSFDSYLETLRLLRREDAGAETPVSRYLEDIEALYHLGENQPLPPSLRTEIQRRRHASKKK